MVLDATVTVVTVLYSDRTGTWREKLWPTAKMQKNRENYKRQLFLKTVLCFVFCSKLV